MPTTGRDNQPICIRDEKNARMKNGGRKIFEKTQDLEISLKRDIDEFDLINGQNNSAIEPHNEELLVVVESEADPINL